MWIPIYLTHHHVQVTVDVDKSEKSDDAHESAWIASVRADLHRSVRFHRRGVGAEPLGCARACVYANALSTSTLWKSMQVVFRVCSTHGRLYAIILARAHIHALPLPLRGRPPLFRAEPYSLCGQSGR